VRVSQAQRLVAVVGFGEENDGARDFISKWVAQNPQVPLLGLVGVLPLRGVCCRCVGITGLVIAGLGSPGCESSHGVEKAWGNGQVEVEEEEKEEEDGRKGVAVKDGRGPKT
jgi:hypothetical protein